MKRITISFKTGFLIICKHSNFLFQQKLVNHRDFCDTIIGIPPQHIFELDQH